MKQNNSLREIYNSTAPQQTQSLCITFVQCWTKASTLVQHCANVVQMFCVYWGRECYVLRTPSLRDPESKPRSTLQATHDVLSVRTVLNEGRRCAPPTNPIHNATDLCGALPLYCRLYYMYYWFCLCRRGKVNGSKCLA